MHNGVTIQAVLPEKLKTQPETPGISFGDILMRMHHLILPKPLAKNAMLITTATSTKTSCHQINPLTGLSLLNYKKSVSRQLRSLTNLTHSSSA
ncbi:MAG: hypothetical protein E6325_14320 [Enterobacteriaceae bacterium]|nr:hypothetical protein [Enterobacteriaceae bacterium]